MTQYASMGMEHVIHANSLLKSHADISTRVSQGMLFLVAGGRKPKASGMGL
jgi:hypothetical protein